MTEFEYQPEQDGFSASGEPLPLPVPDCPSSSAEGFALETPRVPCVPVTDDFIEEIKPEPERVAESSAAELVEVNGFHEPGFSFAPDGESERETESAETPKPIRPHFRPLWTIGQTHAPFADVSLQDDSGVFVTTPRDEPPRWRFWAKESLGIARDVALALAIAVLIGVFVIQPVKVEGTSMLPRLHDGERIFINRFIYNFRKIERGDIVVFYYPKDPGKNFIKRVIGLPGDEITISNGKLRINGQLVPENYLSKDYTTNISAPHTWVVEPHHYFVMGDNRDASNDSRSWGYVPEMYIYGKAVFRYWPLSEAGGIGDDPADLKPLRELGRQAQNDPDEE